MEVGLGMEENKTEKDFFTFDEENVEKVPKKKKTKSLSLSDLPVLF